ncbi:MAG: DNA repair protein RecN [Acidobacteria bacterium]|nr:DNA repair protein RecN [Acidobacteriota bacterium]NIM60510.1 DNA repair protein RecN [Acidobacteriota bacterium]NIO59481.1 DNA repair protein RecN [Acidobacteriota bacterium]NIQ30510.1 DNA repair protein RecN [Acidobacteriota bacterium]NIQ85458.1 DNA repair protein RecN [Acidobacteriota bacterium]
MLLTLRIRQFVLVDDWTLEFQPGLTLLTGETGAGKSILVNALGWIAGERADRGLVRKGADSAVVEAAFELDERSPAIDWAADRGFDEIVEERQVVIRREVRAEGSGKIRLNGSPCTLAMLRELGGRLLELHGQHDQQSLLSPERHLELIDRFGGHGKETAAVAAAFGNLEQAQKTRQNLQDRSTDRLRRAAELRADLAAIETVAPEPGEAERLDTERRVQANAVKLGEWLGTALAAARDGEPSAASLAAIAERAAREAAEVDPALVAAAEQFAAAGVELEDAASVLRDYRAHVSLEPGRLDEIETRRGQLKDLFLRFGPTERAVLDHAEVLREELDTLDQLDDALEAAAEAVLTAERDYTTAATRLTRARERAAKQLVPRVETELAELAMAKARFDVAWSPTDAPTLHGAEGAMFRLEANPGEGLRPLHKVASGGELSRVMLALHAVLENAGGGRVLIFDEVDTGVGGAVADAIGSRLAGLARRHQALCVTHLPQVAAYADGHLRISKRDRAGRTLASIESLDRDTRVEELARMLAGREPTSVSRRHATELLAAATAQARRR